MADEKGNTGDWNTGYRNTGDCNTGSSNTGYRNTGYRNTGDWNTGDMNTGNMNTGNRNTGYRNTANRNTGDMNTGNSNTGNWNTGDWNTGNSNTGNSNTGNSNTGMFNIDEPNARFFGKESNVKMSDFLNSERCPSYYNFLLTEWIDSLKMTSEEKKLNPSHETTGGYLKVYEYKEAWANFWKQTPEENKQKFLDLPNFNAQIFKTITGIDVCEFEHNSNFIAAAPSIVRQLLEENEELQRCYDVTNKSWSNMATENQRLTKALEKIASDDSWDEGRQTIAIKTLRGE